MNYTKGEWKVEQNDCDKPYHYRIVTNKYIVAAVYSEDNAHLIAAAPDMYDALREILQIIHYGESLEKANTIIYKVMTKAEGK
jgi:hypothetical protein